MKTNSIYTLFTKVSENAYLNGLCNVFVMLLPVSLFSAFSMLIGNGLAFLDFPSAAQHLHFISTLVWKLFPILLLVYYGLFLARLHKLSRTTVVTPSLLIYVIVSNDWGLLHAGSILPANYPLAIATPLFVSLSVKMMMRKKLFLDSDLPNVVDQSINLILGNMVLVFAYTALGHLIGSWGTKLLDCSTLLPNLGVDSLADALWYELVRNLLWSIGINGHIIFSPFKAELYELTLNSFQLHKQFGTDLPILTSNFYDIYAGIGGSGNTLSLVLCMLLFTKNKGYRALAAATLVLSLFNINEPILFGLPVIFNPVLIIPFLITPLVSITIAYFATALGFVPPVSEFVSWMTPGLFSGYLATGHHISGAVLQLVIIVIGCVIYLPFFKQMDRVIGSHAVFSKGSSDEFFNYEEIGNSRTIGLLPHMSGNLVAQRHISNLQKSGEFVLFYQPQVDSQRNCVSSLEVLIRHRSHDGTITPPSFLNSFAQLGLTSELDMWVIRQALSEVAPLANNTQFKVSINVSPETFLIPEFAQTVTDMISRSALDFHQVELEITEDVLIQDEEATWNVFHQLKQAGIGIALDDFGAGYSSIGYLSKFDYDKVKIDRSLVSNLKNRNGQEMFRLTSEIVRLTGAEIVVEGVETEEEYQFVSEQNIRLIQGYYYYKPMPFEQVCEMCTFCS